MKKEILLLISSIWLLISGVCLLLTSGCTIGKELVKSTGEKNVDMSGYTLLGKVEIANPETGTPEGKLLIGRLNYKSRRLSIPKGQIIPNTGNYKLTKTKNLFGAEELIIEYDFTAESSEKSKELEERLQKKLEEAQKIADDGVK